MSFSNHLAEHQPRRAVTGALTVIVFCLVSSVNAAVAGPGEGVIYDTRSIAEK